MAELKAKMQVWDVEENGWAKGEEFTKNNERVILTAVYSPDPADENYSYSQATPSAHLTMTINNPQAFGFFEKGQEYVLTFEKSAESKMIMPNKIGGCTSDAASRPAHSTPTPSALR